MKDIERTMFLPDVDNPSGLFPIKKHIEALKPLLNQCRKCGAELENKGIEDSMLCWWCHTGYEPGASGTNNPPSNL